jgi:hypothetical protein
MKVRIVCNATARVLGVAALAWSSLAAAQTVVVQPGEAPARPPPTPPVIVTPGVTQAQPPGQWVAVDGGAPVIVPQPATPLRLITRPSRTRLMTGLIAFGQSYIASIGVAATSRHRGDSNLWIPALGPWLDLGIRPGCPSFTDCGMETANRVLLVADGILQTFGMFQIIGAFMWPETVAVPAVTTGSGATFSLTAGRVGREGYGLCGIGKF